jgi:hypothetical protein
MDVLRICCGFTKDLEWICYGFALYLLKMCYGFTKDLLWN